MFGLQGQQPFLLGSAARAGKSTGAAIGGHDPMTGNDDGHRVLAVREPDRPRGTGAPQHCGKLSIGRRRTRADTP